MVYPSKVEGSSISLARRYTLALLDLDGVVYRGANPVEHAASGIQEATSQGMRIAYTTNNPSRYPDVVAQQISSFGIDAHGDDVITSAMVSAAMLSQRFAQGTKVLVIGKDHLKDELAQAGMVIVSSADDEPDVVIQSWYPELDWNMLAQAAYAIEKGAQYFVTNRDMTIPREQGIAPGNGALQLPVIAATGKEPIASAGKPEAAMYHQARHLFSPTDQMVETEQCLPVGDRLDTDIEAANRGGYHSAVVLTGVANAEQIIKAEPILRPTYICADLRGLTVPQPEVEVTSSDDIITFTYRQSQAWILDKTVHVKIAGKELSENIASLDALRAVASAAWEAVDSGRISADEIILPRFAAHILDESVDPAE
ncbi:HAD-IIA family hydrolase [Alloscardovia theropitheci]|uniref:HAD-IIA family hydrolase n=1 Tax=Alloscardovia theropitheci TaxID=2496842 RepID=A0A4R0QWE5_9BIFI|nr:HAD-IIA family hydrolase [Alloscardovia theropitheci]TCD53571.1 HAD-IIA family hydrolase [Alloscardovia theropitheci]